MSLNTDKLNGVDFILARDAIANIIHIEIEKGKERGEELYGKEEFANALEMFTSNPCLETAIKLLTESSFLYDIFEKCKPGGILKYNSDYFRGKETIKCFKNSKFP